MEKKEGYQILNSDEIIRLSEEKKGSLVEQLEYNEAVVEELNDDSFLIIPQNTFKGLLVYEKTLLDSMVSNNEFPKETDSNSFYELFKPQIECIENEIYFFEDLFLKHTRLQFDYTFTDSFIVELEEKLNSFTVSEKDNISPILSILINEAFRRNIEGKWVFSKQYSLNTFQIPLIEDAKKVKINVNKLIFDELSKKKNINLKETLISLIDSYVMQKINGQEFNRKELYKSLRTDFKYNFKNYLNKSSNL